MSRSDWELLIFLRKLYKIELTSQLTRLIPVAAASDDSELNSNKSSDPKLLN